MVKVELDVYAQSLSLYEFEKVAHFFGDQGNERVVFLVLADVAGEGQDEELVGVGYDLL